MGVVVLEEFELAAEAPRSKAAGVADSSSGVSAGGLPVGMEGATCTSGEPPAEGPLRADVDRASAWACVGRLSTAFELDNCRGEEGATDEADEGEAAAAAAGV